MNWMQRNELRKIGTAATPETTKAMLEPKWFRTCQIPAVMEAKTVSGIVSTAPAYNRKAPCTGPDIPNESVRVPKVWTRGTLAKAVDDTAGAAVVFAIFGGNVTK